MFCPAPYFYLFSLAINLFRLQLLTYLYGTKMLKNEQCNTGANNYKKC
jgi:hypothetical protein